MSIRESLKERKTVSSLKKELPVSADEIINW